MGVVCSVDEMERTAWLPSISVFSSRAENGYTGSLASKSVALDVKALKFPAAILGGNEKGPAFRMFATMDQRIQSRVERAVRYDWGQLLPL
jgi:uncharacterized protein (DUF736 family)